jgi:hypothetical protein
LFYDNKGDNQLVLKSWNKKVKKTSRNRSWDRWKRRGYFDEDQDDSDVLTRLSKSSSGYRGRGN